MSSELNGSAVSRPAPVARSADEWATIMADFERSGMSQRDFCESRSLSVKTFSNWPSRLGPGVGKGSFVELAPPAVSGWDVCWVPECSGLRRRVCPTFPAGIFFQ